MEKTIYNKKKNEKKFFKIFFFKNTNKINN